MTSLLASFRKDETWQPSSTGRSEPRVRTPWLFGQDRRISSISLWNIKQRLTDRGRGVEADGVNSVKAKLASCSHTLNFLAIAKDCTAK